MTNQKQLFEFNPGPAAENAWGFPSFLPELTMHSRVKSCLEGNLRFLPAKTSQPLDLRTLFTEMATALSDYGASAFALMGRTVRTALIGGVLLSIPLKLSAQDWTQSSTTPVKAAGTATPIPVSSAPAGADPKVTTMPEVTVLGSAYKPENTSSPKLAAPLRDVPQSVSVIPSQMIQDQGTTTLRETLRNIPGITMNAGENGTPAGDNFNIRGFSAKNDMFHDGIRDLGTYSRDAFAVDKVEVTQGPSSSFAGRGSTGGTINVVSKLPQREAFAETSLSVGTANGGAIAGTRRGTVDINEPLSVPGLENTAFRLTAMQQDSGVAGRQYIENKGWGIAPAFSFRTDKDLRFTLAYYALKQDNTPDYGIPGKAGNSFNPPAAVDPSNYYGLKNRDHEYVDANNILVKMDLDLNDSLRLRNQLAYGRTAVDRVVTTLETVSDANRKPKSHVTLDEGLDNQTDLTLDFETGGVKHTAVAGVEYVHEYSGFSRYGLQGLDPGVPDVNHPNPFSPGAPVTGISPSTVNRVEDDTLAAYALDTVKLDDQWQVTGGARWDYFLPHNIQQGVSIVIPPIYSQQMVSWHGGLIFKPAPEGSVYLSVGDSFNPSVQGLSLDSSQSANIGSLPPEENLSYEAGIKWDLAQERLSVTGAAFRTDKVNARMANPDDPASPAQIMGGKQRVDGFYIGVQGSPVEKLNLFGAYTYLKGSILEGFSRSTSGGVTTVTNQAGFPLAGVPESSASLWATYELPFDLQVGGGAQYSASRPTRTLSPLDPTFSLVPEHLVFNAMLSYPFNKNIVVQLNLSNLLDEVYFTQGRFWLEGTRRSGVLTTTFRF